MRVSIPALSKSRFLAGVQCHKRLYWQLYAPELAEEPSDADEARFDQGTRVGELARDRFPGGQLVTENYTEHVQAMRTTRTLLGMQSVPALYEAAFRFDDIRVRTDILVRLGPNEFDLVEVKSSTGPKPQYEPDLAVQLYVLEGSGLTIRRDCLLHLNNEYVYGGGPYDLTGLFTLADLTGIVREMQPEVPRLLAAMREPLWQTTAPVIAVGDHCTTPYTCEFYAQCHPEGPEHPITELPRLSAGKKERLEAAGIQQVHQIPENFDGLTDPQQRVRDTVVSGELYVDPELPTALSDLTYPLQFIDFESFYPALPLYAGTRPYQQIPFQWSHHTLGSDGTLTHCAYVHDGHGDPRLRFLETLLESLGTQGPVLVYNMTFERGRLDELAEAFPAFRAAILRVRERLIDLLPIVRNHVYAADFHGSFSLKDVFPALVPDAGWEDLAIQEGTAASLAYAEIVDPQTSPERRNELREHLLAYCARDTEAMVRVYQALLKLK